MVGELGIYALRNIDQSIWRVLNGEMFGQGLEDNELLHFSVGTILLFFCSIWLLSVISETEVSVSADISNQFFKKRCQRGASI